MMGKTFLKNHMQALVALSFLIVPSVRCQVRFVLVILAHQRLRIVYFNVTEHHMGDWTAQQVVER
jgi:hypothetical protein